MQQTTNYKLNVIELSDSPPDITKHSANFPLIDTALNGLETNKLSSTGNASNTTVAFTAASADADIATGEKLSVLFGKILKRFSTLATALAGKAPTSHANSATTYGAASDSLYGHAKASATTPKIDGTAAVGSETSSFARGDHVHPTDTSRVPTSRTVNGKALSADVTLTGADVVATGYAIATTAAAVVSTDTVNAALAKIEKKADDANTAAASKASSTHTHAGVYEPANSNIQAHVTAAHAPSTAQKNSDITKAEIEAKLTGAITSHTHAYAPISHASTATTYGIGTTANYGHCMTVNALTTSAHADGKALSAYQGYVLNTAVSAKASMVMATAAPTATLAANVLHCVYTA